MLGIVSEDENHNKIFKPMAGATLGQGVPLGTWCSFEKDVAPSNNWLMAGTTFDASVYPALNLYLGTNVVPSRYDHSRLGDWETITLPTTSVNAMTMEYDGELYVMVTNNNNTITQIYVNTLRYDIGATAGGIGGSVPIIIPVKKGDTVYQGGSVTKITTRLAYYTHPLFIKATSIASDTDQQAILAQIQAYNTYSTEETLTGKTLVINGVEKPIYRKVINSYYTVGSEILSDVEYIVKANGYAYDTGATTAEPYPFVYPGYTKSWVFNMSTHKVTYTGDSAKNIFATFEYTKTTDV